MCGPEQYTGAVLDKRTDIYAIGAVLYYMLTGEFPDKMPVYPRERMDRHWAKLIRTCLKENPEERYESADRLARELEQIRKQMEKVEKGVFREDPESSLTIAIAGAFPGAGTTHVASGFAACLWRHGLSVLYEEKNGSDAVRQMAGCEGCSMDSFGIYRIHGLPMLPLYGEAVKLESHPYRVVIQDYGTLGETFSQEIADGYLLVCGSKPWQWKGVRDAVQFPGNPPGMAIIYNQFCGQLTDRLPGPAKEAECFLMPDCPNPFTCARRVQKVYDEIFLSLVSKRTGGKIRALLEMVTRFFSAGRF